MKLPYKYRIKWGISITCNHIERKQKQMITFGLPTWNIFETTNRDSIKALLPWSSPWPHSIPPHCNKKMSSKAWRWQLKEVNRTGRCQVISSWLMRCQSDGSLNAGWVGRAIKRLQVQETGPSLLSPAMCPNHPPTPHSIRVRTHHLGLSQLSESSWD